MKYDSEFINSILDATQLSVKQSISNCQHVEKPLEYYEENVLNALGYIDYPEYDPKYNLNDNTMISCIGTYQIIKKIIEYNKKINCIYSTQLETFNKCYLEKSEQWNTERSTAGHCDCSIWSGSSQKNPCGSNNLKCAVGRTKTSKIIGIPSRCDCDCTIDYNQSPMCQPTKNSNVNMNYITMFCGTPPIKLSEIKIPNVQCQKCTNVLSISNVVSSDISRIKQINNCITTKINETIADHDQSILELSKNIKLREMQILQREAKLIIRKNQLTLKQILLEKETYIVNKKKNLYNKKKNIRNISLLCIPLTWICISMCFIGIMILVSSMESFSSEDNFGEDDFGEDDFGEDDFE